MTEPREFRYWERAERPLVRRVRAAARAVLGFDLAPPDDVVRAFAAMYYDADPVAEAFVEDVYLGRGADVGRAMLERALEGGVAAVPDAPQTLASLLEDLGREPDWLDWDEVERGARAFRRFGPDVFEFAGAITLQAYSESSVAKPLALTGAYAGKTARKRFLETASFWIAVSEAGALRPDAPGRAAALRVRVMHVFVRRKLLAHPEWNAKAWGVPISQADALLTLMGGSFAPGVALHALGYRTSVRDIEAMMHFWRFVGHLMGVRPHFYPRSMREAAQLTFVAMLKGAETAGEDGKNLCRSYAQAFAPDVRDGLHTPPRERRAAERRHRAHVGTVRLFLPPWTHAKNGLPPAGAWALLPLARAPFVFAAETLRRAFPSLDTVADAVARRRRTRWLAARMGEVRAEYRPAERFTR
jgi:hypothetical protein